MLRNPAFWVVLFLVIILLFGANKLPGLAGSVGKSLKIFKKEVSELQEDSDGSSSQESGNATISYNEPTAATPQSPPSAETGTQYSTEQYSTEPPK